MEYTIPIKEAEGLVDVSISTIRRAIDDKSIEAKKIKGRWMINKDSLLEEFRKIKDDNGSEDSQLLRDTLEVLRDQLKEKDKQIESLQESLRNAQILHKQEQDKKSYLPDEESKKKKGFLGRLFSDD
jgi:type I site-specific restriction-modification system R (restriction) subunit